MPSELDQDYEDVDGLVNLFFDPQVLTRPDAPYDTLEEMLAHAEENRMVWGAASPARSSGSSSSR